jgi:hypothetical protein
LLHQRTFRYDVRAILIVSFQIQASLGSSVNLKSQKTGARKLANPLKNQAMACGRGNRRQIALHRASEDMGW